MKKLTLLILNLALVIFFATGQTGQQLIIDKPDYQPESDRLTPEGLWAMGRLSDAQVSPDGKTIIYGVTYYSIEQNKGNRDLYAINADGSNLRRLTKTSGGEYNAIWRPDGKKIGFLSAESGSMQIWEMNPDGSDRKQISNVEDGVTGFKYAPNQKMVVYTKEIMIENKFADLYEGLPKASGRLMNDLMYRHWDSWKDSKSHVFVAEYDGEKIWNDKDIMEGEPYDAPLKPFGGMEQIDWSPDGNIVAYTSKKKTGKEYTISTNSEIYFYNLDNGKTTNITEGMMGYDVAPVFSPDGKYVAWESMERDGYESDKNRLYIMEIATGDKTYATKDFDQNVGSLTWTPDSKSIYFTSDVQGTFQIYQYTLKGNKIEQITNGLHDYNSVALAGNMLIGSKQTMALPTELFEVNPKNGNEKQLTFTNKELLDKLTMGVTEGRWMKTHDGEDMLTWIIYPPNFDPNKKYPALLYCKGGPQGPLSQNFHYRWNYQIMAANDYIIVAPNRRGVSGFGQAWQEQISGDYGGQNMLDYLTAIDAIAQEPYVDETRLGCVGASYGGFSAMWLAGHHEKRFKAFIAHAGIFNFEQQYLETEEMWFANWDFGGPYWDKTNEVAQRTYANSPHLFVDKWDTPILFTHGEKDFRILASQSMAAFNAAVLRDVPAQLLVYPDENHWILRPQNGILWQRTFATWLDKWLK